MVSHEELEVISSNLDSVLSRLEFCFRHTENKYYQRGGEVFFNPFHSGQWCIFLYYLSNTLFKANSAYSVLSDKIYYLNKMLNGCDLFYEVELPPVFMLDHPVGTVLGRAKYGNYFTFTQGCTVGNNKGIYPVFGEHVTMLSDSKVIGSSIVGDNVVISANCYVKDAEIPSNAIVFGQSPHLVIKHR